MNIKRFNLNSPDGEHYGTLENVLGGYDESFRRTAMTYAEGLKVGEKAEITITVKASVFCEDGGQKREFVSEYPAIEIERRANAEFPL